MDQKQKELIENCDAVVWASVVDEEGSQETLMNFFRVKNNVKPTDLGYKYSIMTFKQGVVESIDIFSAIIGDPQHYAERMGGLGYNGIMFKQKSCKKTEMRDIFAQSLKNWGFEEKQTKVLLKQLG